MFSREYLIKLGECCGEGCLMCPYDPENIKGSKEVKMIKSNLDSGFHKNYNKTS